MVQRTPPPLEQVLGSAASIGSSRIEGDGPDGRLPLTAEMLRAEPSGNIFGLTQNAGMGWRPDALGGPQYVIVSTMGGLRSEQGEPIALGYHTGHWEIGLLVRGAAEALRAAGAIPFAVYCSDPCDGRTQGTTGMFDSLAYRNDAAIVMRRLIRSLPTASGVIGIATCDKGLPAHDDGPGRHEGSARRDRARRRDAARAGRRRRRPGPEPRRPVRARSDQPGLRGDDGLPCVRLVRRGMPVSRDGGDGAGRSPKRWAWRCRTARSRRRANRCGSSSRPARPRRCSGCICSASRSARSSPAAAVENAMLVHAAFGGSTNLLLHVPAIAAAAG